MFHLDLYTYKWGISGSAPSGYSRVQKNLLAWTEETCYFSGALFSNRQRTLDEATIVQADTSNHL